MASHDMLGLKKELPHRRKVLLTVLSFLIPLMLWCAISYIPWLWHPLFHVTDPGSVDYFVEDMDVPRATFDQEVAKARAAGQPPPQGYLVNPVYLPAPHRVLAAFY